MLAVGDDTVDEDMYVTLHKLFSSVPEFTSPAMTPAHTPSGGSPPPGSSSGGMITPLLTDPAVSVSAPSLVSSAVVDVDGSIPLPALTTQPSKKKFKFPVRGY